MFCGFLYSHLYISVFYKPNILENNLLQSFSLKDVSSQRNPLPKLKVGNNFDIVRFHLPRFSGKMFNIQWYRISTRVLAQIIWRRKKFCHIYWGLSIYNLNGTSIYSECPPLVHTYYIYLSQV